MPSASSFLFTSLSESNVLSSRIKCSPESASLTLPTHLKRMRLYYTKQREAVLSVLKEEPFKCVGRVREADSGLHFILELNTLLSV